MKKAIYTGLFLTEESAINLKNRVMLTTGDKVLPNIKAHHLTLAFRPEPEQVLDLPIGKEIEMRVTGLAADERAQAVLCEVPEGLTCTNKHPHITVATGNDSEGKPISPVKSNDVIEEVAIKWFPEPLVVLVKVGIFNGKEDQFDLTDTIYMSDYDKKLAKRAELLEQVNEIIEPMKDQLDWQNCGPNGMEEWRGKVEERMKKEMELTGLDAHQLLRLYLKAEQIRLTMDSALLASIQLNDEPSGVQFSWEAPETFLESKDAKGTE